MLVAVINNKNDKCVIIRMMLKITMIMTMAITPPTLTTMITIMLQCGIAIINNNNNNDTGK